MNRIIKIATDLADAFDSATQELTNKDYWSGKLEELLENSGARPYVGEHDLWQDSGTYYLNLVLADKPEHMYDSPSITVEGLKQLALGVVADLREMFPGIKIEEFHTKESGMHIFELNGQFKD